MLFRDAVCQMLITELASLKLLLPCFLQSFMPRLIKMATRELSVLFGPQKLILVALVCRVFSGFCFLVASFLWLSE